MKEIIDYLTKFEKKRGWDRYNRARTKEEKIELLYKEIVALLGEFGEFANIVKGCKRDKKWEIKKLKEELVDMFIFLIKISKTLNIDLEKEFFEKNEIE